MPLQKVGVEIEIYGIGQSLLSNLDRMNREQVHWEVHDDGSIRSQIWDIQGVPYIPMRRAINDPIINNGRMDGVTTSRIGLELVSSPTKTDTMLKELNVLSRFLAKVPGAANSSIHLHMDVSGQPFRFIRNMIGWFWRLEAIWYRYSTLGMPQHRGELNDFKYIRPLSAPICWGKPRDGDYINTPIFDIHEVLGAKTLTDMLKAWGRYDVYYGGGDRWIPHRLHGINIVPLMRQGTMELRIFNGSYGYLPEVVKLGQCLYRLAECYDFTEFRQFHYPLGYEGRVDPSITALLEFDKPMQDVITSSRWVSGVEDQYLLHHYAQTYVGPNEPCGGRVSNGFEYDTGSSDFVCYGKRSSPYASDED